MFRKLICVVLLFTYAISFSQSIKIDKKKLQFLTNETRIGVKPTFPDDLIIYSLHPEKEFIENMKRIGGLGEK